MDEFKGDGDMPAHPVECVWTDSGIPVHGVQTGNATGWATGLTKREQLAAMAMQGILANRVYDPPRRNRLAGMAMDAVSAADALLAELAKATTP